MKSIAFYNNKGGVGKTTATINVAYMLQTTGKRILVVDCDTQQNTFRFLSDVLGGEIVETRYDNIYTATINCVTDDDYGDFDIILLDLPPAMNETTKAILKNSDFVFVPIELGTFSIQGLSGVTDVIAEVNVRFGGCFVSKFDKKNATDKHLLELMKQNLGEKVLEAQIPLSNAIKNSVTYRMTVSEYMKWCPAATAFGALVDEIMERIGE